METIQMNPPVVSEINDSNHEKLLFAVPPGYDIKQFEKLFPEQVVKQTELETVEAYIEYVKHHEDGGSQQFYSRKHSRFTCVFDYHDKSEAGRCKSVANLSLRLSEPLKFWMDAATLSHRELVNAVIDHEEYLTGSNGREVIENLRRLEIRSASSLDSTVDPETGDISVNWATEKTSGGVKVPRVLNFGFPIFQYHDEEHFYEFEVRIRVEHGDGKFAFAVKMKNPDKNIYREFLNFAGCVSEGTKSPLFQGLPG